MATISKIIEENYTSGNVAMSLSKGDLAVICGVWCDDTAIGGTKSLLVDGNTITTYDFNEPIYSTDVYMYQRMGIYIALSTASFNVSMSPTATGYPTNLNRLIVLKITPSSGASFESGCVKGSATDGRNVGNGVGAAPANTIGDILVIQAAKLPANSGNFDYTSPASEYADGNFDVNAAGYWEFGVGAQISESVNDTIYYTQSAANYTGGLAISIRESYIAAVIMF